VSLRRITRQRRHHAAGRVQRRDRRPQRKRVCTRPPARCRQLAHAERRRAPPGRHRIRAGLALRPRASVARRWRRATSPTTSKRRLRRGPATGARWSTAGAAASAQGRWPLVLDQIGFSVHVLDGGYQAFRRAVLAQLQTLPGALDLRVLSWAARARARAGCCRHWPGKALRCWTWRRWPATAAGAGAAAGPTAAVAEGVRDPAVARVARAGRRHAPCLWKARAAPSAACACPSRCWSVRAAPCIRLEMPVEARVQMLLQDYAHFVSDAEAFCERLTRCANCAAPQWSKLAGAGARRGTGHRGAAIAGAALRPAVRTFDVTQLASRHRRGAFACPQWVCREWREDCSQSGAPSGDESGWRHGPERARKPSRRPSGPKRSKSATR
jgi:hypothetical protein